MADLPTKKRYGNTVVIGISINPHVVNSVREYAKQHQWSFSKALENLARIALDIEAKKKPESSIFVEKRIKSRHREVS